MVIGCIALYLRRTTAQHAPTKYSGSSKQHRYPTHASSTGSSQYCPVPMRPNFNVLMTTGTDKIVTRVLASWSNGQSYKIAKKIKFNSAKQHRSSFLWKELFSWNSNQHQLRFRIWSSNCEPEILARPVWTAGLSWSVFQNNIRITKDNF